MKTQIKRFSKSTLAVVLTLCMLFSCMTVGIIATDAAKVDSGTVGAHSTDITVYYAPNFDYGSDHFDANYKPGYYDWKTVTMTDTGKKYNGYTVFSATIQMGGNSANETHGIDNLQFQRKNSNNSWVNQVEPITSWNTTNRNGQLYYNGSWYTSPKWDEYELHYEAISSSNGGNWSLSNTVAFDSSNKATLDVTASGVYCYVTTKGATQSSGVYYKAQTDKTALSVNNSVSLTQKDHSSNYGGLAGKVQFKPGAGKYIFTFNPSTKILSVTQGVTTYTGLTAVAKGTTDGTTYTKDLGSIKTSFSASSSTGQSLTASSIDGYTFAGWSASGSGSFSEDKAETTTFYPSANNEIAIAQYKKNYTITVSPSSGTSKIAANKTAVVAGESYTITVTAGSTQGLSSLKLNGTDVTSSVSSNKYNGTASGDNATLAFVATFADTVTATAIKKGDGSGSVTINAKSSPQSVAKGSDVTFKASATTNYTFCGWYSDSNCTTLVSYDANYTLKNVQTATTLYADFEPATFYLSGYLREKNWQGGGVKDKTDGWKLTQDSTNKNLFKLSKDVTGEQYVIVNTANLNTMYLASELNASSGTAATAKKTYVNYSNLSDSDYRWHIEGDKWPYSQHIDVVWDAVAKKLSWTITDVDASKHSYVYVKKDSNTNRAYVWDNTGSQAFGNYPGRELSGFPTVTRNGVEYYLIDISSEDLANNATSFAVKINDGGDGNGIAQVEGLVLGKDYSIQYNSSSKTDVTDWKDSSSSSDTYYLAGVYADGTPYFFGTAWSPNVNQLTKNGSVYEKTFTSNIPAGTIKFKVVKNGSWDDGSWPEGGEDSNQTYVIKANATEVKFSFDPTTHKITVTQKNTGSGDDDSTWPPTDVTPVDYTGSDNTQILYYFGSGSEGLTSGTLASRVHSGNSYWVDLTDEVSKTQNNRLYITITSNGKNSDGFYANSGGSVQFDKSTYSPGVSSGEIANNYFNTSTARYFGQISFDQPNEITHLGVLITKDSSNNCTYKVYTTTKAAEPVTETKVVDIYAKNGTLRDGTFNRFTNLANTNIEDYFEYTEVVDGEVKTYNSISAYNAAHSSKQIVVTHDISYNGSHYDKMTNVPVGAKIKLKTTLSGNASDAGSFNSKAFRDTHYLKAYSFNGMTYQVHTASEAVNGAYEEIWTVRAVNTQRKDGDNLVNATLDGKAVEVTPIYYMKDNTNCKTFYIDGYDGTVKDAWGNLLCVYPYYEGKSNKDNAFGGYPGQPMLFWGGKYQMEIPLTVDGTATGASVKGLTLHNGYWDLLHRSLDSVCNARNHAQTYDYDDFYKLYKEKNPDSIIFSFKYRTASDNYGDGYDYTNYSFAGTASKKASDFTNANGVELVTDYFGRQVDAFGNLITNDKLSKWNDTKKQNGEILFVSTGYKDTYVGEYATIWAVYRPNGNFLGYISSSMLYLSSLDRVKQYTNGTSTDNGRMSWKSFKDTYNALKAEYAGVPALISYEKEIWNNSKDMANRSDGKWYYSNKTDKISASIEIQYGKASLLEAPDKNISNVGTNGWKNDAFDTTKTGVNGENNIGTSTGNSAYFTNTSPYLMGKTESGEQFADNDKYFTFQAQPAGAYMFAGWVRYSDGKYYEITEDEIGQSNMSANDVYIARFVEAEVGSLNISHVVEQTDTYTGKGTPSVTVLVKNGNSTVVNKTVTDGSKIDISDYINSKFKDYTIDITLKTTPDTATESRMEEIVSSSANFSAVKSKFAQETTQVSTTVAQFTVQEILDSGVTSLRYVSHLSKPTYTYSYEIKYTYNSRFWGEQSYTVTGTFENDIEAAANMTGSKNTAKLKTDFIINKTPYEKNFRQIINWNYTEQAVGQAKAMVVKAAEGSGTNYKLKAEVYSSKAVNDKVRAEIQLPYQYDENAGYTAQGMDLYDINDNKLENQTEIVFDESIEGPSLETQAYKLFTYDGQVISGGDDVKPSSLKLVEAAPFVWKNATWHYKQVESMRYYTGNYFTIGNVNYYYTLPEGQSADDTHKLVTANTKVTWNGSQRTWAVLDSTNNQLYSFKENGANGQYTVTSLVKEIDGVVEGTGEKCYFTRWDIYNSKGTLVASGYNRSFNFSGYENYIVKAVYESSIENQYAASTNGISATITYLDDSRNQWNNNGGGNYATVTGQNALYAADKLFADFAIAYSYNGQRIDTISSSEHEIKLGMVIERLGELDSVGTTKITDSTYYADKYKDKIKANEITAALKAGTSLTTATGNTCYNSKIGSNFDSTWGTKLGSDIDDNSPTSLMGFDSVIDNFNRLQWFYTFNNTTQRTQNAAENVTTLKNYAYRATSYIIVDGEVTVASTPAYFTLWDTATREHN